MGMDPAIISSIITATSMLAVSILSILVNNRLVAYKVDELSKKVEKHNNVVERTACLERDVKSAFIRLDEVKDDIKRLEDRK